MGGCYRLIESNGAAQPAGKVNLLCLGLFNKRMHLWGKDGERGEQSMQGKNNQEMKNSVRNAHKPSTVSSLLFLRGS